MSLRTFGARRARARRALLAVIAAMTTLITLTLAGTLVYLDLGSTAAVQSSLRERPAADRGAVVQTRLDQADPAGQDATVQQILSDSVEPAPPIWHAVVTGARELPDHGDAALVVHAEQSLAPGAQDPQDVTVVAGEWPTNAHEGALHAGAADALDLDAGEELTFVSGGQEYPVRITALWQPSDPDQARWGGQEMVQTGTDPVDPEVVGPLLVDLEVIADLDDTPFARWSLAPPADLGPDEVAQWARASAQWHPDLRETDAVVRGLTVTDGLHTALTEISETLSAVRAAALVPLVIVGLLSVVAAWQLAHLLAVLRRRETLVLVSRGADRRQVNTMVVIESVLLAIPGTGLAGAVLWAVGHGHPGFNPAMLLATCAGVAAAVAGALILVGTHATRTALSAEDASGRAGAALTSAGLVMTIAAAAFTLWRLRRAGGPLLPGTVHTDPLAVAGTGLGLLAGAVLAIALATPLSRIAALLAARRRGFSPVTESRQVSRRIALNAVPVMLLVLATATTTLAAAYSGTWTALRASSAQVSTGADVRVPMGPVIVGANSRDVAGFGALDGVQAAAGVLHATIRLDGQDGQLTATPAHGWEVSSAPDDVLEPITSAPLAADGALTGPDLPAGTDTLEVTLQASAWTEGGGESPGREVLIRAWLWDGDELVVRDVGSLSPVAGLDYEFDWSAGEDNPEVIEIEPPGRGDPVSADLSVELPAGQWQLVGLDVDLELTEFNPIDYEVQVTSIMADGVEVVDDLDEWAPVELEPRNPADEVTVTEPMALQASVQLHPSPEFTAGSALIRMLPPEPTDGFVPVLTTPVWSEQILDTGTTVQVGAVHLPVRSMDTLPVVPGNPATHAVVADLPTLLDALLRHGRTAPATNEVWMSAASEADIDTAAAAAVDHVGPHRQVQVAADGSPDPLSLPALVVFWAAALSAVLLALPGVVAVALAHLSRRRGEVVVLRAVGTGSSQQGASRRREFLGVGSWGLLAGVAAGAGLAALVVVDLVRSTTPGVSPAVPVSVTYDLIGGVIGIGAIAAAVLLTAWWYGRRVRAQALDTAWREETR